MNITNTAKYWLRTDICDTLFNTVEEAQKAAHIAYPSAFEQGEKTKMPHGRQRVASVVEKDEKTARIKTTLFNYWQ